MKRKRIWALLMLLALSLSLLALPAGAEGLYADVPENAWYAEAAAYCAENGLMDGVGEGLFAPKTEATRAMVVTVLYRLSGSPYRKTAGSFTDVAEGKWYAQPVGWAAAEGITTGRPDGSFAPEEAVSRQDLTVFIWRSLGCPAAVSHEPFGDEAEISAYALEAVHWARAAGIVNGMEDGTFAPKKGASRAELATMLMKLDRYLRSPGILEAGAFPAGLALGEDGSLVVADTYNKCVWLVKDGESTRLAGAENDGEDEPAGGYVDAAPADSLFLRPWAVAPFLDGWAVADTDNNAIRIILGDEVQTINAVAGSPDIHTGIYGATYDRPMGLAADEAGNLYVSDTGAGAIRVITATGLATTLVSGLEEPTGLCWHDGSLYVAETGANRILKITGGSVQVLAGTGEEGLLDGAAKSACFSAPKGVTADSQGRIYVADTLNSAVRRIADGQVVTLLKAEPDTPMIAPVSPVAVLAAEDSLYVSDNFTGLLLRISIG